MDYLQAIPVEMMELIIAYLNKPDFYNILMEYPYLNLLNWSRISKYRFGSKDKVDIQLYDRYLSIQDLQYKLYNTYIAKLNTIQLNKLKRLNFTLGKIGPTLPAEIGLLINLTELVFYSNNIETLPPEIGNLTNLVKLDIRGNPIKQIPNETTNLVNLKIFDIPDHIPLDKLPHQIGDLYLLFDGLSDMYKYIK